MEFSHNMGAKIEYICKKCILLFLNLLNFSDNMTLAICPGICNSSESVYIRRVVYHAQLEGFRVAVLNHIGALKTLSITSPRYIYHFSFWHNFLLWILGNLVRNFREILMPHFFGHLAKPIKPPIYEVKIKVDF